MIVVSGPIATSNNENNPVGDTFKCVWCILNTRMTGVLGRNHIIGCLGENYLQSLIERAGLRADHPPGGCDFEPDDGTEKTAIEVKSANLQPATHYNGKYHGPYWNFTLGKGDNESRTKSYTGKVPWKGYEFSYLICVGFDYNFDPYTLPKPIFILKIPMNDLLNGLPKTGIGVVQSSKSINCKYQITENELIAFFRRNLDDPPQKEVTETCKTNSTKTSLETWSEKLLSDSVRGSNSAQWKSLLNY